MSGVGELLLRMIVSLAIVLALVAAAYSVARRRQAGVALSSLLRRKSRAISVARLEVEARAGLARGSSAVAVRFADRIVLVGVNDGAPSTVLAEVPAELWDTHGVRADVLAPADPDDLDDLDSTQRAGRNPLISSGRSSKSDVFDPNGIVSQQPGFIEALRTATSRRS